MDYTAEEAYRKLKYLTKMRQRRDNPTPAPTEEGKVEAPKEGKGEKWTPANESDDEGVQDLRDKVYTEYLDSVKADAILENDPSKFNQAERDFFAKYAKNAVEPNKDAKLGKPYKPKLYSRDYIEELEARRAELEANKREQAKSTHTGPKQIIAEDGVVKLKDETDFYRFKEARIKQREGVLNEKLRSGNNISKLNQEFLYKYKYNQDHPETSDQVKSEESVYFKILKNGARSKLEFNQVTKHASTEYPFTDNITENKFARKIEESNIIKGFVDRDSDLYKSSEKNIEKDLSEIADSDPDNQNIYRKYMNHKDTSEDLSSEDIAEREREFLDALESQSKRPSTFQEYEDYKRLQANRKQDIQDTQSEDATVGNKPFSRREWLAKIWSGQLTNQEFEDHMIKSEKSIDKFGLERIAYTQKDVPGYGQNDFISTEDKYRLTQEMLESKRRFAVQNNIIKEEHSQQYIQDFITAYKERTKMLNSRTFKTVRDQFNLMMFAINAGNQIREYYFDPKQGVSVEQHIEKVKKINPDAIVTHYHDKNGFTIIKKVIKNRYTYDLEQLLTHSPADFNDLVAKKIKEMVDQADAKCESKYRYQFHF